ncbi:class IV adenylate cyclase [Candidatus Woesearchaeota archaeon]|nr:class IV adenylate cyclase [Candidatus Woesearchaeota archaeon]
MKEIEVKILDIDKKEVEEKLVSLGAEKVFEGDVNALFFDFDDGSVRAAGKTIRLRKMGDKSFLTAKSPVSQENVKIKEEYETEVSDFEEIRRILESAGMSVWLAMRKHRTTYRLDNVSFEIDKHNDQYSHIPEFLEIEAKDAKTIYKYAEMLGFNRDDCKPWTILEIDNNIKNT